MIQKEIFERPIVNINSKFITAIDEKFESDEICLNPVITLNDYNNGCIKGLKTDYGIYFRDSFNMDLNIPYEIVGIEDREIFDSLISGDVFTFDGHFSLYEIIIKDCYGKRTRHELRPTGIFNIVKLDNKKVFKKFIELYNQRISTRYVFFSDVSLYRKLITPQFKEELLKKSKPNAVDIFFAALMLNDGKYRDFYIDEIIRFTGWKENDIGKNLNALADYGEILLDNTLYSYPSYLVSY